MKKRLLAFALLLMWLLPALACNLPLGPRATPTLSSEHARQTYEAIVLPTLLAAIQTPIPFGGLTTVTPPAPGEPTVEPSNVSPAPQEGQPYIYFAQSGDTLPVVAAHFGVEIEEIAFAGQVSPDGFIDPGTPLALPIALPVTPYPGALLPDSEIVYGPSAADFDIGGFIDDAGGFLSGYSEPVENETLDAAEIVRRLALETSINPRVLLAVLEYRSGWVYGQPRDLNRLDYPIGFQVATYRGLQKELTLAARQLTLGYYGWRLGILTELDFIGGAKVRVSPQLNAGSVAVQYLFTRLIEQRSWETALYGENNFLATYARMFGDPWQRAARVEPLFPAGFAQTTLELPFAPGERWSMTGGPHIAWGVGSPRAALDFAPVTGEPACQVSRAWALAAAPGVITRSERAQLALDLDSDGNEQTGWVLFYYHLADKERAAAGTQVKLDDRLGHPSCQGARATGTHFHIARKYNGEWLPAGLPLPFVISGWTVQATEKAYEGFLVKGDKIVSARPNGEHDSIIIR